MRLRRTSRRCALVLCLASACAALVAFGGATSATGASNVCGATGVLSGSGAGPFTCTYDTVGSDTFTVPAGVTSAAFNVVGAIGGNYFIDGDVNHPDPGGAVLGNGGGGGGGASGTLSLTPGSVLQVDVAGAGATGTAASRSGGMMNGISGGSGAIGGFGGSDGGVAGGPGDASGANGGTAFNGGNGAGGGGSSDVRVDPAGCVALTCSLADRVFVGAGGGGNGGSGGSGSALGGAGGSAGGASGANGVNGAGGNNGVFGSGASATAGGAGGLNPGLHSTGANPLDPRYGGDGADGTSGGGVGGHGNLPCTGTQTPPCSGGQNATTSGGGAGGGAGGGYFGGGGGSGGGGLFGGGGGAGGGGGGGGSYVTPTATSPVLTAGANAYQGFVQTNANGSESFIINGSINSGNGQVTITWTPPGLATPTLATQASPSVAVGGQITDSATLSGGSSPTGTITFDVYGPGDTSCGTPLATSTATLTGDGTYSSAAYTPTTAGTYEWVASYSGDANNNSVAGTCGASGESVAVTSPTPGAIAGTVTSSSGAPLSNICVYLYASGATGARTGDTGTCTNAAGQYSMTVASAGSYNVAFYDPSGTYLTQWNSGASSEASATAVTVSSGTTTSGINATMTQQTAISGTVTNSSGTPLSNICVYLYGPGATGARAGDTGTCTNSAGQYSMTVASAGSYNVAFYDPSGTYLTQWNSGASSEASATAVSVSAGASTTVNATMTSPTQITGSVTNASGTPLANICVYLYNSGATGTRTGDTGTCTNAAGQYTMTVASAGSYNVAFYDPSGNYLTQWFNGKATEATANPVTVTSGATTPNINASMSL